MDIENKYGTLEIQKALLVLLEGFNDFCEKESIKYSLDSGSLLGAVRHNGFIPWDDDLDIVVDRKNYYKILDRIGNNSSLTIERNTDVTLWIDRIRMSQTSSYGNYCPTLDVFIMDHVPDHKLVAIFKKYMIYMLQGMIKPRLSLKKGTVVQKAFSLFTFCIGRLFSHQVKYRWYHQVSQWFNNTQCKYSTCYNYIFSEVGVLYHSTALDTVIYHDFESLRVPITSDYDYYLKSLYGDYMTLPKEEDRKPIHI